MVCIKPTFRSKKILREGIKETILVQYYMKNGKVLFKRNLVAVTSKQNVLQFQTYKTN